MFLVSAPSHEQIDRFLSQARKLDFSYCEIGATSNSDIPAAYVVDHNRVRLGTGLQTWDRAVEAIRQWKMFEMDWLRLYWPTAPIVVGQDVAVLARYLNCHWLNGARIVYVVDEDGPIRRFGFAYGTLSDHAESGEERFSIEWHRQSDEVWYDILAFSRPNQFWSKIGYPFARRLQKKFAAESKAAMVRAVGGSS